MEPTAVGHTRFHPSLNRNPTDHNPIISFIDHVQIIKVPGSDGGGEAQYFCPPPELDEYWEDYKIQQITGNIHGAPPPSVIRTRYLRVFSTLVYTDQVSFLSAFTQHSLNDDFFPVNKFPSTHWPEDAPPLVDMFAIFRSNQWMFFPLEFNRDQLLDLHLPPERILPLELKESITEGDSAKIFQILIHESCNKLHNNPSHQRFVLKTYDDESHRNLFDNERGALTALQGGPSDHVITYYGSFEQNGSMNLVLEYVDGGDLLDYLNTTQPPQTPTDVRDFWTSIVGILKGFRHIHQWTQHHENAHRFRIVHQDLKPDNIFIVRDPSSPYKFQAKVADFGCSHVRIIHHDGQNKRSPDRHGNPTYSAPECTHHARDLQSGPDTITPKADIFGLGCILSEVVAWVADGQDLVNTYRLLRKDETAENPHFHNSGYDECFHNGADVLRATRDMQRLIINYIPHDLVTLQLLDVIHEHMLVGDPNDRWEAKTLRSKFEDILKDVQDNQDDVKQPPSTPTRAPDPTQVIFPSRNSNQTVRSPTSTASDLAPCFSPPPPVSSPPDSPPPDIVVNGISRPLPQPFPNSGPDTPSRTASTRDRITTRWRNRNRNSVHSSSEPSSSRCVPTSITHSPSAMSSGDGILTIDDVLRFRNARKDRTPTETQVEMLVNKLQRNLNNRDHFFFVDDSPSMSEHSEYVLRAFTAMSYVAKLIDSNGIEMAFASDPRKVHRSPKTSDLIKTLGAHVYNQESGMMEAKLEELVDNVIIRRLPYPLLGHKISRGPSKPISIFIFTDGCWGENLDKAANVQTPIARLMQKLRDRGLNRTQVMIQFVRFGDNEDGKKYLKILDEFGQKEHWDIVDTRHINDNVYAMFIGSLSPRHGNKEGTIREEKASSEAGN